MPVFRVEKSRDYTTMCNIHLRDQRLTLKAKGLLSLILSLPDDWNYSISGLAAINKESRDSIRTAINELEENGYIVRNRRRTDTGKLSDMEYVIYERPVQKKPVTDNPMQEKPMLENPTQENPVQENPTLEKSALENATQLKKDIPKKEIQNTYQQKKEGTNGAPQFYGTYQNVTLTDMEFQALRSTYPIDYVQKINRLSEYMESSGRTYKNHFLTICQWAKRDESSSKKTVLSRVENYDCEEGESY